MTLKEKSNLKHVLFCIENTEKFMQKVKIEKRWRAGYLQALSEVKQKLKQI